MFCTGKALIRQLRNQIEDLECARSVAVKSKQSLEADLCETQAMLEEANKQKSEAEDKANAITRERSDLQAQIEENEEELAEVMKKYKATVQQMSLDQISLQEQVSLVSELETERNHLRDQLAELASKLESVENMGEASSNLHLKRYSCTILLLLLLLLHAQGQYHRPHHLAELVHTMTPQGQVLVSSSAKCIGTSIVLQFFVG